MSASAVEVLFAEGWLAAITLSLRNVTEFGVTRVTLQGVEPDLRQRLRVGGP
jgi:hypothetical protein